MSRTVELRTDEHFLHATSATFVVAEQPCAAAKQTFSLNSDGSFFFEQRFEDMCAVLPSLPIDQVFDGAKNEALAFFSGDQLIGFACINAPPQEEIQFHMVSTEGYESVRSSPLPFPSIDARCP